MKSVGETKGEETTTFNPDGTFKSNLEIAPNRTFGVIITDTGTWKRLNGNTYDFH